MVSIDHRAAAGASRRQGERDDAGKDRTGSKHFPLSRAPPTRTSARVETPEIFDRALRRLRRDRAAASFADYDFLHAAMVEGIVDRLADVRRTFADVLLVGAPDEAFAPPGVRIVRCDAGRRFAARARGVQADEDRLPFADAGFDLAVSIGVLDSVNDLPGALTLIRRALRPDGLFLGAFLGGATLSRLRGALRVAEPGVGRVHPMVDVRSAGDLLVRAGFALPVADVEGLDVRYRDVFALLRDLRGMAATSVLRERVPLSRETVGRMSAAFAAQADPDGRVSERFDMIFVTGWSPDPSQPKPARRGSAAASLQAALSRDVENNPQ